MAVVVKSHVPLTVKTAYVIYSMDYVLNANLDGLINLAVEVLFLKLIIQPNIIFMFLLVFNMS